MQSRDRGVDLWFLASVAGLTLIGVVMVYSSTSVPRVYLDRQIQHPQNLFFLKRHLFTLVLSTAAMYLLYRTSIHRLRMFAYPMLGMSLLLLIAVFVPGLGVKINGAQRWLKLWPSTFQPSEFAKFAMILFLARYLSERQQEIEKLKIFLLPVGVMLLIQGLLLKQPDFGGAVVIGLLTLLMLYLAGVPRFYLISLGLCLVPPGVVLVMQPYRLKRLVAFLDPWADPKGAGFQLVQSLIALGRGGLIGVGIGNSQQKLNFLPEANTDFIFSLIGEEMGFLGASLVLVLFFIFFYRGVKISSQRANPFSRYLAFGLTMMVTVQAVVNMAVVTGLLPTKGLPLPFVSYGGSSLLVNFMAVGVLLRLSKREMEYQTGVITRDMLIKRRVRLRMKTGRLRLGV